MKHITRLQTLFLLVFVATLAQTARAQTAQLTGGVSDSNSAVIKGATVNDENLNTGLTKRAVTNDEGNYQILFLPPGPYRITVQMNGFRPVRRDGVTLQVDQAARLDFELQIGEVTQAVSVTAEAPLLDSETSSLGEVVNSRTAETLPLNGRNVLQLIGLAPGINTTPSYRSAAGSNGSIESTSFTANGGRNLTNEILVDGSSQIVMGLNQPAYVPNPDAVQEFKVQTNSLSAEYGRTGGAVVNVVSRAGTKEFHGALFEFLRNDAFDANNFFANLTNREKTPLRYNQFGGTLGGPVKFRSGGEPRTFFFFSYEGTRVRTGANSFFTVPTAGMKNGDFSEILGGPLCVNAQNQPGACGGAFSNPLNVRDTAGRVVQARQGMIFVPGAPAPAGQPGAGWRVAFADNIIPAAQRNPFAQKILSFYPDPNLAGIANNYFSQESSRNADNNISVRIDHVISGRQNLFGRFSMNNGKGARQTISTTWLPPTPAQATAATAAPRSTTLTQSMTGCCTATTDTPATPIRALARPTISI